jgi:hypothetical protein
VAEIRLVQNQQTFSREGKDVEQPSSAAAELRTGGALANTAHSPASKWGPSCASIRNSFYNMLPIPSCVHRVLRALCKRTSIVGCGGTVAPVADTPPPEHRAVLVHRWGTPSFVGSCRAAPKGDPTPAGTRSGVLFYGTGGLAYGERRTRVSALAPAAGPPLLACPSSNGCASNNEVSVGSAAGLGMEYKIGPSASVKAEWLHYVLGGNTATITYVYGPFTDRFAARVQDAGDIFRVGLSFQIDRPSGYVPLKELRIRRAEARPSWLT